MRVTLWFVLWTVFQASARAQDAPQPPPEEELIYAQRHFERGRTAFKAEEYETAISAFRSSLQLFASPNTRLYLARTLTALNRLVEAANTYEEVVRSARLKEDDEPSYRAARLAAQRELSKMREKLARVTVALAAPAEEVSKLEVNADEVASQAYGLPIYVLPGKVTIKVEYLDGETQQESLMIDAQERKMIFVEREEPSIAQARSLTLAPPSTLPPSMEEEDSSAETIGFGIATGIAVAGWGSALLFGILADSRYDKLHTQCGGICPSERKGDIDEGELYQTLANTGLVVGAIGTVAAGVALMFLLDSDAPSGAESKESISLVPTGLRVQW